MDPGRRTACQVMGGVAAALALRPAHAQALTPLQRTIPATREALPAIGLGTWQVFDAGTDSARRVPLRETLAEFARSGGRVIDSSPMYGSAESVVGDLSAELKLRDRLFLATKVWTSGRDEGVRQMEQSLSRLRAKRLDLMQIHNLMDVATHTRTLADWKAKGRVRYVGITHYHASAYPEIERLLKTGHYDFLQINYSMAETGADEGLLPLAQERGVAVIVNRPFAEGALFHRVRGKPLPEWAQAFGAASWAQFFLKWILGHPAVTCAIPGTGRVDHLRDNLAAGLGPLPDAAMRRRMSASLEALQ